MWRVLIVAMMNFGMIVSCGDLSEIEDERIRDFVKRAKRVVIEELMSDGNTQQDIDGKIDVIAEALVGDSGTAETQQSACRETGRKTLLMFLNPADHISAYFDDRSDSGFECTIVTERAQCSDANGVCQCEADDILNPEGSTSFAATCSENGGASDTFNFSAAETLNYNAPSGGGATPRPTASSGTYSIKEQYQSPVQPGQVFPLTVIDMDGTTVTPDTQASLAVYDSGGIEINDALGRWTTEIGDSIYDVNVAGYERASFNVFLLRDTQGVAQVGGTVDGTAIAKATLSAARYADANDIEVFNDTEKRIIRFMFSGAARTALNDAYKTISYIVTDGNGEVVESMTVNDLEGLDIPSAADTTFVAQRPGLCVANAYVMIRIGNNRDKTYLPRCQER